jgi:hypothetical protein
MLCCNPQHQHSGRRICDCPDDEQIPVTSPILSSTGHTHAANISPANGIKPGTVVGGIDLVAVLNRERR